MYGSRWIEHCDDGKVVGRTVLRRAARNLATPIAPNVACVHVVSRRHMSLAVGLATAPPHLEELG